MKFTASQIAEILEGEIVGNPQEEVSTLSKIEEGQKGSLTFLSNPKYTSFIYTTNASVVVVNKTFVPEKEIKSTLLKVDDAYSAFSKLLAFYAQMKPSKIGVEQPSFISDSATIGKDIYLGAFAYIGNNVVIGNNVQIYPNSYIGDGVTIGDNTIIFSGVHIYYDCKIGNNCVLNSGAVIGADGFGFAPQKDGSYNKIPQIGNVVLEDNIDIGASTTIDRATIGSTIIKKGVKLDNLVQIAHNSVIGDNTVMAAQAGVAGSTSVGKNCMVGGQTAISGHLIVGDKVIVQGKTGVTRNTRTGSIVKGVPAFDAKQYNKSYVYFKNLPKLAETISRLEKEIKVLKEK